MMNSMTTLLEHFEAQQTECRFLPKQIDPTKQLFYLSCNERSKIKKIIIFLLYKGEQVTFFDTYVTLFSKIGPYFFQI